VEGSRPQSLLAAVAERHFIRAWEPKLVMRNYLRRGT